MRELPLTQGLVTLVDDDVYEWAHKHKWYAAKGKAGNFYARRDVGGRKNKHCLHLHREVLGVQGSRLQVDHIDGNGLNNLRENLRLATNKQNSFNRGKNSNNTSGYKGVIWVASRQAWHAQIKVDGRHIFLGAFSSPEEAHAAYCSAAASHHKDFACFV